MIKNLAKIISFSMCVCIATSASADWPISLTDKKTIHPNQFLGSYNVSIGNFSRTYQSINVLDNDFGTDLRIVESNLWSKNGGNTVINRSGRGLSYVPPFDFVGDDTFWYVMEDNQGRKNSAKVTVTVKSADSRFPDPSNDEVSVQKNTSIRLDVLKNDVFRGYTFDGTLTQFNEWSEKGGQIKKEKPSIYAYPQLIYTPPADFTGTDTFWYAIRSKPGSDFDDEYVEHAAKVTIEVTENNQAGPYPVAKEDFGTVNEVVCTRSCPGTTYNFFVTTNDTGKNLKVTTNPYSLNGGSARVIRRSTLSSPYILYWASPKAIAEGQDKIWYTIEDEVGRKNWSVVNVTLIAAE